MVVAVYSPSGSVKMTMSESQQEQCNLTTETFCSPPPQQSPRFSPSTPSTQRSLRFSPSTPPPQPPKRNPKDQCYSCKRLGHWSMECPSKSPKKSQSSSPGSAASSSSPLNYSDLPVLRCLCGVACKVFTSKTKTNPGRKFYTCPLDQSVRCNFFKWCDEIVDKYKPPSCPCGAGACSLNVESSGPYKDRWYFACRIKKNHGACRFFQWVSSPVKATLNVSADESKGYSASQSLSTNHQVLKTVNSNSCEEDDWSSEELELAMIESLDYHSNLSMNSPSEKDEVPDTNPVMQETESQDAGVGNKLRVPQQVSLTRIHFRQTEFSWKISAAGNAIIEDVIYQILGFHVHGWLGRLAFPPPQCLKEPPAASYVCGIFPSFDPVIDDVHDIEGVTVLPQNPSNDKNDTLQLQSPREAHPVLQEPPGFQIVVQNNDISSVVLKTFGKGLVDVLQSMDHTQHETMLNVAEATFDTLSRLSVNYEPFSKAVKEYIHCASRLAGIEGSMGKDFSSEAFISHYNDNKSLFDSVSQHYAETVSAHEASENCLKLLRDEYSRVRDKLLQLEEQISLCEDETSRLQSSIVGISEDKSKLAIIVDAASEKVAEAMKLEHEWDSMVDAANAALHNARVQLQQ